MEKITEVHKSDAYSNTPYIVGIEGEWRDWFESNGLNVPSGFRGGNFVSTSGTSYTFAAIKTVKVKKAVPMLDATVETIKSSLWQYAGINSEGQLYVMSEITPVGPLHELTLDDHTILTNRMLYEPTPEDAQGLIDNMDPELVAVLITYIHESTD